MQFRPSRWAVLAAAAVLSPSAAYAQSAPEQSKSGQPQAAAQPKSGQKTQTPQLSARQKVEAANKLESKVSEMGSLKTLADAVTKKMAEIAGSGKLTNSDESVKALQQLVEEMQKIREALQKVTEEVEGIKGWIEGQNEALPIMAQDLSDLKARKTGNYVQFQWMDTQEGPNSSGGSKRTNSDGFMMRRFRIGTTNVIDSKTSMKLSFDVSAGSQRIGAELKDAFLMWVIEPSDVLVGKQLSFGQQPLPLGYELERSSSEREFPERANYNRTMFGGERGRGVNYKHGLGNGWYAMAGVWDNLTTGDPQLTDANTYRNLEGTKVATTLALRKAQGNYEFGISTFSGNRAGSAAKTITSWTDKNGDKIVDSGEVTNINVPATSKAKRQYVFLDGQIAGVIVPQLTLRGEYMIGKDRVPTISSSVPVSTKETNVRGWHVIANYALNARNMLSFKYETFDPGYKANDDVDIKGIAWSYFINPGAKIVIAHEQSRERGFDRKNDYTTIRVQFKL